jgi:hypothetical protein
VPKLLSGLENQAIMKKAFLLLFVVLAQIVAGLTAHAQTQTLFDYASRWRYLDNGSDQGTTWKDIGFNDASWTDSTGIFGYGDPWITTCIRGCATACGTGCPTKFITTYFRKNFNIADVNKFSGVTLNVWRDDGIVVYVNGVRVWESNMTTGAVNYLTNALTIIDAPNENTPVSTTIPISAFVNGNNLIAVEVHQRDANSSDVTFNMQALGVIKTSFVTYGSQWKYLTGSDQGTTWRNGTFNDASWATGTGHMGYGESWTNTCIPAGPTCVSYPPTGPCSSFAGCNKYPTIYFRKTLNISDPAAYDSMRFSLIVDDGAVVYVNGTEVSRINMPATPGLNLMTYNTLTPTLMAENTAVTISIPISAFTAGDNQIAIEVHQNGTGATSTSSDADFNAQITGVVHVVPALVRGPYLQMGNQTSFMVRWRTNVACKSKLEVGTVAGTFPLVVNDPAMVTEHEITVSGLNPETKYFYRFGTNLETLQGDTTNFCVTAPATGSHRRVTIAAYGDCGQNSAGNQTGALSAYQNFLSTIGIKAADLMLLVGDNAYNSGTDGEYQTGFFNAYQGNILKNHMLFPAPGNHDYENGSSARQNDHNIPYYSIFTMPQNGESGGVPSGTEAYYSYNWGDVHVLSLDSYGREDAGTTRLYDTLGAQVQWIKADLAANSRKWVVAYWHHPPYTMGSHNSDNEGELVNIRQNFIQILERMGVDVIICGHSHDYERSYLMKGHFGNEASFNTAAHAVDNSSGKYNGSANSCPYTTQSGMVNHGTVYVVSGSSGASGGTQGGYPHNALPFSLNDGGMFFMDINDNRLDAKFIRKDNSIYDQFTIMKDVKVQDTVEVLYGESVALSASWSGNYSWAPGVTTRTVTATPLADTLIEVKDNATNTCLTDKHYVDVLCTTPDITTSPSDITRIGCDAMVTYAITDTGRPAAAITYAFTGATSGTGNGTGSGTTFSVGVTTVTLTAANECGSSSKNFRITIQALPTMYNVTGGGGYCPGGTGVAVGLSGSQVNVNYQLYNGATAIGTPVAGTGSAISFGIMSVQATYSVLATDVVTNCTKGMNGNVTVFVHPLPQPYTVTGTGNYCLGASGSTLGLSGSQAGVNYQLYTGTTAMGSAITGTGAAISFGSFTTVGTYSAVATNTTTTCVNNMNGSTTVSINPLPAQHNVTGGGNYCMGGTGVVTGLDNSAIGFSYQLYNGTTPTGSVVAGTGAAISFGAQTASAVYTAKATNDATGCVAIMNGNATVAIDPLPSAFNITGGGNYCATGTGVAIGLDGAISGTNYQLYNGSTTAGTAVAGTGSSITFGLQTSAGTYSVLATIAATGCTNAMSGSAAVGIYALPTPFSVTGGGEYCNGGSGVTIGLGGSNLGTTYQLHNGTTPVGAALAGSGAPLSFGLQTTAGVYTVTAVNTTTTCTNSMPGSALVVINPVVTPAIHLSATPGSDVCTGTTVAYTGAATNGGIAPGYEWSVNGTVVSTGAPLHSYTPANNDVVILKLTSNYACVTQTNAFDTITMSVRPWVMPTANITITPNDTLCEGTPVTLSATMTNGGSAPVAKWIVNSSVVSTANSYSYTPADGDGIVLNLASNAPCRLAENVYSNIINMRVNDAYVPVVNLVAVPGTYIAKGQVVVFTAYVSDAGSAPTYKWSINNTVVSGATSATFVTSALSNNDSVSCLVRGSGGCGENGFNSVIMNVESVGVATTGNRNGIIVTPNPTAGSVLITGNIGSSIDGNITLKVTNILGQEVLAATGKTNGGNISEQLTLGNNLADGMYLLTVTTTSGAYVFHIVLKK